MTGSLNSNIIGEKSLFYKESSFQEKVKFPRYYNFYIENYNDVIKENIPIRDAFIPSPDEQLQSALLLEKEYESHLSLKKANRKVAVGLRAGATITLNREPEFCFKYKGIIDIYKMEFIVIDEEWGLFFVGYDTFAALKDGWCPVFFK